MHFCRHLCCLLALGFLVASVPAMSQDSQVRPQPTKRFISDDSRSLGVSPVVNNAIPSTPDYSDTAIPTEPESLFDAVLGRIAPVEATVEVHDVVTALEDTGPRPFVAGGQDILNSAGTFGDVSRYLQILPGVVATSDVSNEMLVRGGHPMENLYTVDGIEVPNINQLATMGSTGGFGPMIDSALIQGVKFYSGGYDAEYPERLSSVTEIRLLEPDNRGHVEGDLGIQGFGGLIEKNTRFGDLLVAGHHGVTNLIGDSIGFNSMPAYTNEVSRFTRAKSTDSQLKIINVAGWDSIAVTPCAANTAETSSINTQYSGWRETTGLSWQRSYSAHSFAVANVSDSEEITHVRQQDQIMDPAHPIQSHMKCPIPPADVQTTPVYLEDSNNAFSSAGYRYELGLSRFALSAGTNLWLQRPHVQVDQPEGAFTPYASNPTRTDTTSYSSNFSTGQSGSFAQATLHPARSLALSLGGRMQTFSFGSHTTFTPRVSLRYGLSEHVGIHAAFAGYAQMPPFAYLLAYPGNRAMLPMRATHEIVGMDFGFVPSSTIHLEAYNKNYRDIPASSEYPSVTLHDLVDMIGQQFVWLPMNSRGRGTASGIELSDITRLRSGLQVQGSIAYSRAMFAGLDRVYRPSNYDFPWFVNVAAVQRFSHGYVVSSRYGFATGRPITPYDLADSLKQNRPIYDVSRMNALRAPYYGRLDAQINKAISIHRASLELYAGVDNILNRANFLAYVWMPRWNVTNPLRNSIKQVDQTPIFPNFGVRLIFH